MNRKQIREFRASLKQSCPFAYQNFCAGLSDEEFVELIAAQRDAIREAQCSGRDPELCVVPADGSVMNVGRVSEVLRLN